MNTRLLRLLGAIFAIAIVAAACGSETTTTSTDTTNATTDNAGDDGSMGDMDDEEHHDEGDHDGDDHSDDHGDDHDDDEHAHASTLDIDPANPIPTVAIDVTETDVAGTYKLDVVLTDFTITPDAVDGEPVANEGHMHLLVDGAKVDRFYDMTREFTLEPGEHIVEVELNANDHQPWSVEGTRINATQLVVVPGEIADQPEPDPADVTISASYADGVVTVDDGDRVDVPLDSTVAIVITSDVAEEVHLHGYDLFADVGPDGEGIIAFTADIAGRFEAELEGAGQFLVELVVS